MSTVSVYLGPLFKVLLKSVLGNISGLCFKIIHSSLWKQSLQKQKNFSKFSKAIG